MTFETAKKVFQSSEILRTATLGLDCKLEFPSTKSGMRVVAVKKVAQFYV